MSKPETDHSGYLFPNVTKEEMDGEVRKWSLLERQEVFSGKPWVRVCVDKIKLPSGRVIDDYYVVELPDYVMIYARRDDGQVLFERHYMHALNRISLVLPTGCIKAGETPVETAKRELLEETGYRAAHWTFIGAFWVDGNKGCGRAHFYMAEGVEKIAEPMEDDMEECEIIFMNPLQAMESILKSNSSPLATATLLAIATNPKMERFLAERRSK